MISRLPEDPGPEPTLDELMAGYLARIAEENDEDDAGVITIERDA